jgi:catechol 2,3-dioxygenase-like lactoylglutathione lyase family enzyme
MILYADDRDVFGGFGKQGLWMATEVTGLDLVFLEVNNLEESLAFYRDQLGFELVSHTPESDPPMATLKAGDSRVMLAQHLETMLKRGRGIHLFFGVANVDEFHRRLVSHNLIPSPPADDGWGGRFISFEDPDKYRLFFVTWHDAKEALKGN